MSKIYEVPLNKGYACGKNPADISPGYWTGQNMIYREDGTLRGRYTYRKIRDQVIYSSSSNIMDIFIADTNIIAVPSDGYPYYKSTGSGSWSRCQWSGEETEPRINGDYRGEWGWLNAKPVYTNRYNYPIIFNASGTNYRYLTDSTDDSYKSYYIIDHQNRLLLTRITTNPSMIRYSEVDDPDSGYTSNYVNVGDEMDGIVGIHNVGGNLIVLKVMSIWVKAGIYSQLTSSQFQPVIWGISPTGASVSFKNNIFFTDQAGIFRYNDNGLENISMPFNPEYYDRQGVSGSYLPKARMGVWKSREWVWTSAGDTYNQVWVYDMRFKTWYRFSGFAPQCFCSFNEKLFTGFYSETGDPYVYEYGFELSATGVIEDEIEQILQTPFLDLGNPFGEKYIKKLFIYGENVDNVEIYTRKSPGEYPETPTYEIASPSDGEKINLDPCYPFREISIKLEGSGTMVIKNIAIEYEERRM